jgi:diguanylate cyclase (GGDEF)-like protein
MRLHALAACMLVTCAMSAQETADLRHGFPLVETFGAKLHQGGTQVFGAAQDASGVLRFGTLRGVMSYDGAWWRTTILPNDSAVFAVATRSGPEIAVGAGDELGWMAPDASGELKYHSLLPQLPASARDVGDVRGVCATPSAFVFVAEREVVAWSGGAPRVVAQLPESSIARRCFNVGRAVYITGSEGLHRLDPGSMTVSRAGFDGKTIDLVVPFDDTRAIVAVRGEGLSLSDGTAFAPDANQWLGQKLVTAGCRLRDGRFVIGTRQDGVLLLTHSGAIEQRLDDAAGLPMAVLAHAFEDREGSLWLAYHGPIVRVDLATPVSLIDTRSGLRGYVNAISPDRGRLWIATSYGLYVSDGSLPVHLVEGVPATAWCTATLDDALLVGTSSGAYLVDASLHARPIAGTEDLVVYEVFQPKSDPSIVWLGLRKGMGLLRRTANGWRYEGIIAGTPPHARTIIEHDGAFWIGATFDGVVRMEFKNGVARTQSIRGGIEAHVMKVGNRLVASLGDEGVFLLGPRNQLIKDEHLSAVAGNAYYLAEDARGDLWFNTAPPRVLPHGQREAVPLVAIDPAKIIVMRADEDGVWFGSDQGVYRFTTSGALPATPQPAPLIARVALANGARVTAPLPHSFGRLRIEFAPASYRPGVTYQYRLDPVDASWSAWAREPFADFTSPGPGDYTFRVRARSSWGSVSDEATAVFTVLPPWYRTRWAMLLWVIVAALLIYAIVRIRTTALRRQAKKLRELVDERTDELRQANAQLERLSLLDELTGIANRRYFQRALTEDWQLAMDEGKPIALVLLDLDHFKHLNDERGHLEGDAALVKVGRFLSRIIRRSSGDMPSRITNIVARIGGEEFAVILTNATIAEATTIAETLRAGIETLNIGVTVSCGVAATLPTTRDGANTLVDRADRALYAAKAAGRNCVRVDDGRAEGVA